MANSTALKAALLFLRRDISASSTFIRDVCMILRYMNFWCLSIDICLSVHAVAVGYNFYGTERMYSGTDGREMDVDIFIGVVYYQRLRHMVYDKYQVISLHRLEHIMALE